MRKGYEGLTVARWMLFTAGVLVAIIQLVF
jgi:hypothetical protein